jgi:hypothetical protein
MLNRFSQNRNLFVRYAGMPCTNSMDLDKFNKLIASELKRQIGILVGYDSSLDTKLGIFLGFVFLVFVQVIALGSSFLNRQGGN